jgi:hypothetical protein
MRLALALTSMMICSASFAFDRPPVGADIDERKEVSLLRSVPEACLSLSFGDVALLVSGERMNSLIRAKPEKWSAEPERLAAIRASRAEMLLSLPRGLADSWGCQTVAVPISQDVEYLLVSEIEEGTVVIPPESKRI